MVSHDPPSIFGTADRVALLYQGVVHALATPADLRASRDPIVQQFITGQSSGPNGDARVLTVEAAPMRACARLVGTAACMTAERR